MTNRTVRRRGVAAAAFVAATTALVAGSALLPGPARADTTVKWLHLEQNPSIANYWTGIAKAYEAQHPGVKIEMQYLENEAYKAKLTTLLQSGDPPDIIYTWGGGVMQEQVKAGVLRDMTGMLDKSYADSFSPAAWNALNYQGKQWGIPMLVSQVGFFYNKELMAKGGVDPAAVKTWDDLLGAVKKLKAAGITPIIAGGADKWPLHFYWSHLAIRLGGKQAFDDALAGKGDGFASDTFVKAGELFKQLVDLEPFQPGFLGATAPDAYGQFGDGKGAMEFMGNWLYTSQKTGSASGKGLADDNLGFLSFPTVPGGKGEATDTLGGINGWLVTKKAPDAAIDFLKFFITLDHEREMAAQGFFIPVVKGADAEMKNPIFRTVASNLAASKYHQLFYDQMLGPNVGRVVNDVSTNIAAGTVSPKDAAQQVQDAWALEH